MAIVRFRIIAMRILATEINLIGIERVDFGSGPFFCAPR